MKELPIFIIEDPPDIITPVLALKYIKRHAAELGRLGELEKLYRGEHPILERRKEKGLSNNKLVCNHAKYIADFTSAFLIGEPVVYTADFDITALTDVLSSADAPTQDIDLAHDGAVFGRSYEIIYANENADIRLAKLSPVNAFVVYDDTVEHRPVFAVYYFPTFNDDGIINGYKALLSTAQFTQSFRLSESKNILSAEKPQEHFFGKVTIDEIYNNSERMGDFENVISLIDAYNILQSDRVNDKEQFVKALLVIKGQVLGDTDEESAEAYRSIKENGVITLDERGDASFLTRQLDESSVEILSKSISHDIHKFSCVPDMSDENFAGNVSGVAMKFKLLALEQMTKFKERFFAEGLRYRLECIANWLSVKQGAKPVPVENIKMQFTHSLPANETELAQLINSLSGMVSQETLISKLPFVSDPKKEIEVLDKEKQANADRMFSAQQSMMRGEIR